MKRILLLFVVCFGSLTSIFAQAQPEAYRLYDAKGKAVSYDKMIAALSNADVAFIGEIHNCALTHWMELKIFEAIYQTDSQRNIPLSVGLEMLEADNQLIINEYLQGVISSDKFEAECRLWDNYQTDYEPLVYFGKSKKMPVVATNVPRRYAAVVKERGLAYLDSLSDEAKTFLPPLPINYVANKEAQGGFEIMKMISKKAQAANTDFMAQAQAIKDATMAWNIARTLNQHGGRMIHFNGSYHSDARNGIIPYLLQYRPKTTVCTVRSVRQEDISSLEEDYLGLADFYIVIPEDMSASY